jgi:hypothetical protein
MDDLTNNDLIVLRELLIRHIESRGKLAGMTALRDKMIDELRYRAEVDRDRIAEGQKPRYSA